MNYQYSPYEFIWICYSFCRFLLMILLRKRHAAAPRNQFEVAEKKMQALLKACVSNGTVAPFGSRCHALPSVAIAHTKNCPGYSPIELDLAFNGHLVYETMMLSLLYHAVSKKLRRLLAPSIDGHLRCCFHLFSVPRITMVMAWWAWLKWMVVSL